MVKTSTKLQLANIVLLWIAICVRYSWWRTYQFAHPTWTPTQLEMYQPAYFTPFTWLIIGLLLNHWVIEFSAKPLSKWLKARATKKVSHWVP